MKIMVNKGDFKDLIQREWFSNLQELEAGLCNITYHRNCSDMEETSEHFLCVHGRFYEYNE